MNEKFSCGASHQSKGKCLAKIASSVVLAGAFVLAAPQMAFAAGGASGAKVVSVPAIGKIGSIIVNPYGIAPLTAIIENGGYVLRNAKVTVAGKSGGVTISYKVADSQLKTHRGIPIFGLYANYKNQVSVEYDRIFGGKVEKIKEKYTINTAPIYGEVTGSQEGGVFFSKIDAKKVDSAFKNRLYFINHLGSHRLSSQAVWNNPGGGALEWDFTPQNFIIDTKGEVRWYLLPDKIYDRDSIYKSGAMMGFRQNTDGALSWGFGQRYVKYDIMGRQIFDRRLPAGYNDYSHFYVSSHSGQGKGALFLARSKQQLQTP